MRQPKNAINTITITYTKRFSDNPIDVAITPNTLNNNVQINTITKQLRYFLNISTNDLIINLICR